MRKTTKIIGLGAVLVVAGAIGWHALAQSQTPGGPGFGPSFMHGAGPGGRMAFFGPGAGGFGDPASHLAAIKTELGITPAQEQAWNGYAKTVQDTAAAMQAQQQKAFETVKTAADKMSASLDDAQKNRAAYLLPGSAGHGFGMMQRAGMGGPMMHGGWWH